MKFLSTLKIVLLISLISFSFIDSKGERKLEVYTIHRVDTVLFPDTNLHVNLDEIRVKGYKKRKGKHYRNTNKYWRTVKNIRIVYPYAQEANRTISIINQKLDSIVNKRERRKLIRCEYNGLMKEYKKPLVKLKISQGKLLMKLIDRETGNSSYYHLKELKGSVTAVFWQSIASMFGTSLKAEYDPYGDDWMVEEILDRMKNNELVPPNKLPARIK